MAEIAADVEVGPDPQASSGDTIAQQATTQVPLQSAVEKSNIIDWDGPKDPKNPMNWSSVRRWTTILIVSIVTFFNAFGSTVFAPRVPEVMHEFHSNNGALSSFIVSVFAIGWAVGPLVLPPLSELYGRNPIYHASNIFLTIASMGCALSTNLSMLVAFRFFMGLAGCPSLSLSGGTIADLIPLEKRGIALGVWGMGPLLSASLTIISLALLRETYAPAILSRKATQLRRETGNMELRSKYDKGESARHLFKMAILRPSKLLLFSPIVFLMALKIAVSYSYSYFLFTTYTFVFEKQYGFKPSSIGLVYIGIGIGYIGTQLIAALFSDRYVTRMKNANPNSTPKPEWRLPPLAFGAIILPLGYLFYGWTAMYRLHWIVPILGTVLIGVGTLCYFFSIMAYLIDIYTIYAASAISANIVLRSIVTATLPLAGTRLYQTLGIGWGTSLLAFIALALAPVPFVLLKYGERIRTHPRFRVNL
ncbi:hypothetical protein PRK78_000162 [Emydomyces testavorans]|uniref:Major facilitator superfamily (MFS) profile domain-containing protein n=1 Tax=Emydomyces testavorans TaxID=2070801 RepID=A0AAF0DA72_9EURO|nr:hypothetical protein PRK78_000162 [Emydomyces testavorans]